MSEVADIVDDLERGLGSALVMLRGMRDGKVSSGEIPGLCVEIGILQGELRRGRVLLLRAEGSGRAFVPRRDGKMRQANDHSFEEVEA
jgi:hypothetical protein